MSQIALVSHQHDNNVRIGVVPQFLKPSCDILVGLVLADIVYEQGADGSSVVGGCDGTISFLPRSIPDLRLDCLRIYLDRPGCEFYTDGGLGVKVELIARESTQQVGFTDARVSDQYDCEG